MWSYIPPAQINLTFLLFIIPPIYPCRSSFQSAPIHGSRPAVLHMKCTSRLMCLPAIFGFPFVSALRASGVIVDHDPRPDGRGYFITALRAFGYAAQKERVR